MFSNRKIIEYGIRESIIILNLLSNMISTIWNKRENIIVLSYINEIGNRRVNWNTGL